LLEGGTLAKKVRSRMKGISVSMDTACIPVTPALGCEFTVEIVTLDGIISWKNTEPRAAPIN